MNVIEAMDNLLLTTGAEGREPVKWQMREDRWMAIQLRLHNDGGRIQETVSARSYMGVPIEIVDLPDETLVILTTAPGDPLVATA